MDWQHVSRGSPVRDILSLLYTSTTPAFRHRHQDTLLRRYHAVLQPYLQSPWPYEEFHQHYLANRKFGFVWGLYIVSVGNKKTKPYLFVFTTALSFSSAPRHQRAGCVGGLQAVSEGCYQEEVRQDDRQRPAPPQQLPRHPPATPGPRQGGQAPEHHLIV